jgi:hypothetical protein
MDIKIIIYFFIMLVVKKITQYKGMVSCYKHRKNVD